MIARTAKRCNYRAHRVAFLSILIIIIIIIVIIIIISFIYSTTDLLNSANHRAWKESIVRSFGAII